MKIISDLEVHSKYARAVSSQMNINNIGLWADKKGIDLVGTGDFTHPLWFRELETNLISDGDGIYKLKDSNPPTGGTKAKFLLTSEVSCMYKDKGKGRRVHLLVYLPTLEKVKLFNQKLIERGANLFSDGRPIMGLSLKTVAQIALSVDQEAILIPAHVWTPWFGFYGSQSGYDSLFDGFEDLEKFIPAIETGLSSDPAMNWRIEELLNKQIVSFGDAHSPTKLGREATAFELSELSFTNIRKALFGDPPVGGKEKISYTIEFYPEEGKYHYTGHAKCGVVYSPNEARKKGLICPVCGKKLTEGVMGRVEHLGKLNVDTKSKINEFGVRWICEKEDRRPPYVMMVPLLEILSETIHSGVGSKKIINLYDEMINKFGSEFKILLETKTLDIESSFGSLISEAILKVRNGDIVIEPGYDGIFGKVKIFKEELQNENQQALF